MNTTTFNAQAVVGSASEPAASVSASGCPIHGILTPLTSGGLVKRSSIALYGLVSYAVFFGTFLYAIGFVTELLAPKTVSTGQAVGVLQAVLINGAMLGAFAIQHTIMARKWFKAWITRFVPEAIERSTFVLAASLILIATFAFWQPMPQVIWQADNSILAAVLTGVSLFGFGLVLYSSFLINHFDLFGLRQVTTRFLDKDYEPVHFRLQSVYKLVRHPLMVGFLIAFWITPNMTLGHLFFAVMTTGYILVGVAIEERDLVADFGQEYLDYKARVRGLIPLPVRKGGAS